MTELWNDLLDLNWVVLSVILAVFIPFVLLVVFGLLALGLYLITRVPPIRWVAVTLVDAATLPARTWVENVVETGLSPMNQLAADQARMSADLSRIEGKAEKATELALKVEAATHRLREDVDHLASRLAVPDDEVRSE